MRLNLAFLLLLLLISQAFADILVDGRVTDWEGIVPATVDATGDGPAGGVDFDSLWVTQEYGWLILRVRVNQEILMQDNNEIVLLIDRDNDSETGASMLGLGVDIRWEFGGRRGTFYLDSGSESLGQADLGIISTPTVTADDFEVAVNLAAQFDGEPLLPPGDIRVAFRDGSTGGDAVPDQQGVLLTLPEGEPDLPPLISIEPGEGYRFITWNVLFDGFVDRPEPFRRILQAIQPNLIVFEEMWDTTPADVTERLDNWLPVEGGWGAAKEQGDIVLATPDPILGSWDIPDARATAFLVQPADFPSEVPILVIGAHPPCCNNDEARQLEIDAIMSWLRDVREGSGPAQVDENVATIITGDMNLVGYAEQLATLVEGTIVNQDEHGPSFHPDIDGTALLNAYPRHLQRNQVYTWRDDGSSYTSGKLDYIIYSDYLLMAEKQFVFDTRTVTAAFLEQYNLFEDDSESASDHLPVVVDFSIVITDVPEVERDQPSSSWINWQVSPNPTNAGATIIVELTHSMQGRLSIYDLLGRQVVTLHQGAFGQGRETFSWDGMDGNHSPVSSGRYFLRLTGEGHTSVQALTIIQ